MPIASATCPHAVGYGRFVAFPRGRLLTAMRILALETATIPGSLALISGNQIRDGEVLLARERLAETLTCKIQALLARHSLAIQEVDIVGLSIGPGSFTGLRIGVTTAKLLAYAAGCRLVTVDTLLAIAGGLPPQRATVVVCLDAQREGVYFRRFRWEGDSLPTPLGPTQVGSVADFVRQLEPDDRLCGAGIRKLPEHALRNMSVMHWESWNPRADVVGEITRQMAIRGQYADMWSLLPNYLSGNTLCGVDSRPSGIVSLPGAGSD